MTDHLSNRFFIVTGVFASRSRIGDITAKKRGVAAGGDFDDEGGVIGIHHLLGKIVL